MTPELPDAWKPVAPEVRVAELRVVRPTNASGLTPEQQAMRRTGIGGSEIAALFGESDFLSPFDVWLSKTQGWVSEETEDMRRGTFLEDGIARWYAQRFGVTEMLELGTLRHASVPVALCTPDRLVDRARLLSIKCPRRSSSAWGEPGSSVVPPAYALQLQWEHAIVSSARTVDDEMHLAALLDGDMAVYIIHADIELQANLLEMAEEWWSRHVVGGEPPSMDGSHRAKQWLRGKFPLDNGVTRAATAGEVGLMLNLELAEEELSRADESVDNLTNKLREAMGITSRIEGPNGYATWKTDKRGIKSFRTKFTRGSK